MNPILKSIITLVAVGSLICLILGLPLLLLWNSTLPFIFPTIPMITFWQAVRINLICCILFNRANSSGK